MKGETSSSSFSFSSSTSFSSSFSSFFSFFYSGDYFYRGIGGSPPGKPWVQFLILKVLMTPSFACMHASQRYVFLLAASSSYNLLSLSFSFLFASFSLLLLSFSSSRLKGAPRFLNASCLSLSPYCFSISCSTSFYSVGCTLCIICYFAASIASLDTFSYFFFSSSSFFLTSRSLTMTFAIEGCSFVTCLWKTASSSISFFFSGDSLG